eukprot:g336.t1
MSPSFSFSLFLFLINFVSSTALPLEFINDDFCDTHDGSDELLTSACAGKPSALFTCQSDSAQLKKQIFASRVGDGVCDCCDGTDEAFSLIPTTCKNTCAEALAAIEANALSMEKKRMEGHKQKWRLLNAAKAKYAEYKQTHSRKLKRVEETAKLVADAKRRHAVEKVREAGRKENVIAKFISRASRKLRLSNLREEELRDIVRQLNESYSVELHELVKELGFVKETDTSKDEDVVEFDLQNEWSMTKSFKSQEIQRLQREVDDAEHKSTGAQNDLNKHENNFHGRDFGAQHEWWPLYGECAETKEGEFTYRVCVMDKAEQNHTHLGHFSKWTASEGNSHATMNFVGGEQCWRGPNRSMKVRIVCGPILLLRDVKEPSKCTYEAVLEAPAACSLLFNAKNLLSGKNPENNELRFLELPIKGSYRVIQSRYHDERGFFQETFNAKKYFGKEGDFLVNDDGPATFPPWKQNSYTRSKKYVFRGLHTSKYGKMVNCIQGAIYDVMVDLREDSETFLRWQGVLITENNRRQVFLPAGVAHGYFTLGEVNDVTYLQEGVFNPSEEFNIHWQDSDISIPWKDKIFPRFCKECNTNASAITLSQKDKVAKSVRVQLPHLNDLLGSIQKNKRVLVIGGSGQVGSAMLEEFKAFGYQVLGTHFSAGPNATKKSTEGMVYFDMESAGRLRVENEPNEICDELMELFMPSVVVVCAGFTWVDGCEASEEKANLLNAFGPAEVTAAAQRIGARTIYLSSEYVFDGSTTSPGPYSETSPVNPVNVYGRSKLLGEQLVI